MYSRTCTFPLLCVIMKQLLPRLFNLKQTSPSVNPINHSKKDWLGASVFGNLFFVERIESAKFKRRCHSITLCGYSA